MRAYQVFAAIALISVVIANVALTPMAKTGAGYAAKILCSEIFLAGRDEAAVRNVEFSGIDPLLERVGARVDDKRNRVDASFLGIGASRAVFREDYGCTLVRGGPPAPLPDLAPVDPIDWPEAAIDNHAPLLPKAEAIAPILDNAMADVDAGHRAIAVFVDGVLIGERYADGFDVNTPLLSWSMAKSVTATMVGAAVQRGYVDIEATPPAPEWRADERGAIVWRDLLQMQRRPRL